ncbi:hypothetical protein M2322_002830 [Rhodoblastus acidophilus]|nr:hypothetical protein [Rhodoblastus acidophilus]MCW2317271.1 hypothetical protein [Rhodoblastus acidophilus]
MKMMAMMVMAKMVVMAMARVRGCRRGGKRNEQREKDRLHQVPIVGWM